MEDASISRGHLGPLCQAVQSTNSLLNAFSALSYCFRFKSMSTSDTAGESAHSNTGFNTVRDGELQTVAKRMACTVTGTAECRRRHWGIYKLSGMILG